MTSCYHLDPTQSQFTVQAFAAGLLSFLGHSPTFTVRAFAGTMTLDGGKLTGMRLQLSVKADSLVLVDNVSAAHRAEIEGRMRREVLETTRCPAIVFQTTDISAETLAPGRYRLRLAGELALHGVTRTLVINAGLVVFVDGIRLSGESVLRLSDYGIRPVSAVGGTIKLKDEMQIAFDLAGLPQAP